MVRGDWLPCGESWNAMSSLQNQRGYRPCLPRTGTGPMSSRATFYYYTQQCIVVGSSLLVAIYVCSVCRGVNLVNHCTFWAFCMLLQIKSGHSSSLPIGRQIMVKEDLLSQLYLERSLGVFSSHIRKCSLGY